MANRPASLALLLAAASSSVACGSAPAGEDVAVPEEVVVQADGVRGVGTFDTIWGIATLDYEWQGGKMVHDGDIVLDPESMIAEHDPEIEDGVGESSEALLKGGAKWAMVNGIVTIPYSFDADVAESRRQRIRQAMDEWESEIPFLNFVESSVDEGRRVRFVKWSKGYCKVDGSAKAKTVVYTNASCGWITYVHEIGHVLGFKHEQKRSDRPKYVEYNKDLTCAKSEFSVFGDDDNHVGDYDTNSIMHYPSCMFAKAHSTCEDGTSKGCTWNTPDTWVLKRKSGNGYIPWWELRNKGEVIKANDKCNFKSLYGKPCNDDPPVCKPATCANLGKECGVVDDGCGGTVSCGGCSAPETCGGGGTPNVCGAAGSSPFPVPAWFTGTMQSHGGACMEPSGGGTTSGTKITMASCSETLLQQNWRMTGARSWKNDDSGKCAEIASATPGAGLTQQSCAAAGADEMQMWRLDDMEIVHGETGRCMNVPWSNYHDGQQVIVMPCDGKAKQKFSYKPVTSEITAGGWCLDAQVGGDVVSGNDVVLRECDGTLSQQWSDARGGFVNRADTSLCMRIEGGGQAADGAKIEVVACNDTVGQMWGLRGDIEGWHDELCLTSNGVGAQVTVATCSGAKSQRFTKWSSP